MKDDKLYLQHILECIDNIESYVPNGESDFFSSKLIQDAVIRNLEIVGEATKRVSMDLRSQYPDVPWREMAGLRDVLIHNYFGVDNEIVWNVVTNELPLLKDLGSKKFLSTKKPANPRQNQGFPASFELFWLRLNAADEQTCEK